LSVVLLHGNVFPLFSWNSLHGTITICLVLSLPWQSTEAEREITKARKLCISTTYRMTAI